MRALQGRARSPVSHGLAESLAQLAAEPEEFRAAALAFMDGLISHYVLDDGRLVVAHAGLKEAYHGRSSGRVRSFALYGDTTGETDEFGLPVRYPWAREYRGRAMVVYGHTPVPSAEWVNNTICLDTGVVFGGAADRAALPRARSSSRCRPSGSGTSRSRPAGRPRLPSSRERRRPARSTTCDAGRPAGSSTAHAGKVKIPEENAAAALEVMSRFAVDPRWLVHLPADHVAGADLAREEGFLEHPEQAFDDYAEAGVDPRGVRGEAHGLAGRSPSWPATPRRRPRRFGVDRRHVRHGPHPHRTAVLRRPPLTATLVERLRAACRPLFDALETDWLVLDAELLPWSAKALGLIREQYAAVGAAAHARAARAVHDVLAAAAARGLDVADAGRAHRAAYRPHAEAFRDAYAAYCRPDRRARRRHAGAVPGAGRRGPHAWRSRSRTRGTSSSSAGSTTRCSRRRGTASSTCPSAAEREAATDWWLELTARRRRGHGGQAGHTSSAAGCSPG